MMNRMKKALVVALAAVTCLTSVPFGTINVNAAEVQTTAKFDAVKASAKVASDMKYFYESPEDAFANANAPAYIDFSVDMTCTSAFYLYVPQMANVQLVVLDDQGLAVEAQTITADEASWVPVQGVFGTYFITDLSAGDYTLQVTFDRSTAYALVIGREEESASINCTKATITAGFSKTLKIDGGKVASWSSSNKKVATVKNGKVTAKKKGKCKITATLTSGQKLTCNVTVKPNEYTESKYTTSNVRDYGRYAQVYKASYDKKGNLVLKVRILNNTSTNYSYIKNVKIVMTTDSGKTIGTYKLARNNVKVGSYSYKDMTYTIKKSDLKIKKADLRNAVVKTCRGSLVYYY